MDKTGQGDYFIFIIIIKCNSYKLFIYFRLIAQSVVEHIYINE